MKRTAILSATLLAVLFFSCQSRTAQQPEPCSTCNGDGGIECPTCKGEAQIITEQSATLMCPDCYGHGMTYCPECTDTTQLLYK